MIQEIEILITIDMEQTILAILYLIENNLFAENSRVDS